MTLRGRDGFYPTALGIPFIYHIHCDVTKAHMAVPKQGNPRTHRFRFAYWLQRGVHCRVCDVTMSFKAPRKVRRDGEQQLFVVVV